MNSCAVYFIENVNKIVKMFITIFLRNTSIFPDHCSVRKFYETRITFGEDDNKSSPT